MSLNIEIKAADADPAGTLERCRALDAVDHGVIHQRDTYFDIAAGRLKLREDITADTAELIFYERPADAGIRASRYERAPVAGDETRRLLSSALGVIGIVEKRRRLWLWGEVRIHLDEIDGLGWFIELEAVVSERMTALEAREAIDTLLAALLIDVTALEPHGYLELLGAVAEPTPERDA